MATKIRLKRVGKKHQPSYRVVVVDEAKPRDTKVLDQLGFYNPLKGDVEIDKDKALQWLLLGAQPTETARDLLSKLGVMEEMHKAMLEG